MEVTIIREILRLKSLNLSTTKISRSVNKARSSVNDMVRKAREVGLKWPLPEDLDDQKLEELLYAKPEVTPEGKVLPDFSYINRELTKKGVTRQLLWEEYTEANEGQRLLQLYAVMRTLRHLAQEEQASLDEADTQSRGEVLCGLHRAYGEHKGSSDG